MSWPLWVRIFGTPYPHLMTIRNRMFDRDLLDSLKLKVPVISIGNISFGGTGKTPVTIEIARHFVTRGVRAGLIARNYKAQVRRASRVDLERPSAAAYFGDEPVLVSQKVRELAVFVGPRKWKTARESLKLDPMIQLLLVDDGLQHRQLKRDFNVVLLDLTDPLALRCFPHGRGRERSEEAFARADWILLTKTNLATDEQRAQIRSHLPAGVPVSEIAFEPQFEEFGGIKGDVVGFSGVARPDVFAQQIRRHFGSRLLEIYSFPDHVVYEESQMRCLRNWLKNPGLQFVTTEKDAVKIVDPEVLQRIQVLKTKLIWKDEGAFFAKLNQISV